MIICGKVNTCLLSLQALLQLFYLNKTVTDPPP